MDGDQGYFPVDLASQWLFTEQTSLTALHRATWRRECWTVSTCTINAYISMVSVLHSFRSM